jgi:predicted Zn-ribbon and HTH transcriptional regulator
VSFDELRQEFQLTVRVLEEDLHHVQRSLKAKGRRLRVENAKCVACGFRFTKPSLHPPGRCPKCRERRIAGPWFRVI